MVWPVGELQVFYKVTSSCLWGGVGRVRDRKGEREERFTNFSY